MKERELFFEIEQNTLEWFNIRIGRLTASSASLLTVKGRNADEIGSGLQSYIYRKAGEIINGKFALHDLAKMNYGGATQRGHDLEPVAAARYGDLHPFDYVREIGFCSYGDRIGCSPDRIVNDNKGLEIKCPEHPEYMRLLDGHLTASKEIKHNSDYLLQCQFSMWVTGFSEWDLCYFHPQFGKYEMMIFPQTPDPELFELFDRKAEYFEKEVNRLVGLVSEGSPILQEHIELLAAEYDA